MTRKRLDASGFEDSQGMSGTAGASSRAVTHHEDCWREEGHHACAVRKVLQLQELLARYQADLAAILAFDVSLDGSG